MIVENEKNYMVVIDAIREINKGLSPRRETTMPYLRENLAGHLVGK